LNPETQLQERFVVIIKDGGFARRPVQIGVADNFFVEVTQGLSPGETVALELPKEQFSRLVGNPESLTNQLAAGLRAPAPAGGPGPAAGTTNSSPPNTGGAFRPRS
jgi:hypothetical protein